MGSLTRKFANNFTTGGLYKAAAINNASLNNVTDLPAAAKGKLTLISSQTASASASIEFTSGIDSTYHTYLFKYINIHPATDNSNFSFQVDTGTNTNYNITTTNTLFHTFHYENDSGTPYVAYDSSRDLAQSTSFTVLIDSLGTDNDQNASGYLYLFNPSSSTFVKHFISSVNTNTWNDGSINCFSAGYFNITTPLTRVQFKMSSGNIDAGTIYMYGIGA